MESNEAYEEWKSLFTPNLNEIWSKEHKKLRKISMVLLVLRLEFASIEQYFTDKVDDVRLKLKEEDNANAVEDDEESQDLLFTKRKAKRNDMPIESVIQILDEEDLVNKSPPLSKFRGSSMKQQITKKLPPLQISPPLSAKRNRLDLNHTSIVETTPTPQQSAKKFKFAKSGRGGKSSNKENQATLTQIFDCSLFKKERKSSSEESLSPNRNRKAAEEDDDDDVLLSSFADNEDDVQETSKNEPKYVYVSPVVRGKKERMKLPGWACKDCENFYNNMGLKPEEIQEKMNQCSKHRHKFRPLCDTPPRFWDLNMSTSEEEL